MAIAPKILLVEDDKALAQAYLTRLKAEGFEAKWCDNGEEALRTALEYKPKLILLDLMMPHVNGFDVLEILRSQPELADIKIVILTALSQPNDIEKAKKMGADEYLVKSQAVITDVIARIRHHLKMD